MRFVRTLFAILIACAVAVAPAFGTAAASYPSRAPTSHHAHSHGAQSAALAHAHHHGPELGVASPCCDDEGTPEHGLPGDCSAMPGCVLKSFSIVPILAANLAAPITLSTQLRWPPSDLTPPDGPAPPLHPPRS